MSNKFQIEDAQQISLCDKLFWEVIASTLIHKDFINEYPGRLVVARDKVAVDNWNRSHGSSMIQLDTYSPSPKPMIVVYYREIGSAESQWRRGSSVEVKLKHADEPKFIRITPKIPLKVGLEAHE